ncbi:pyridoxine/pyridoxamine 5'-phosphate oxidase 1, chloroplastic [Dorcoceras hygrometricum]|uniref:NAD(P)H-hydrate epimerase n=1 Tax=Dorcoceras hygrometricum TaxID=472368 RepID=A0A2Z7B9N9_9LAMI|nr:pyridoxine/pyridoxamine 5'-phosphate oxidase 1, chloroplastic [Dorcoceras hygrometricum]
MLLRNMKSKSMQCLLTKSSLLSMPMAALNRCDDQILGRPLSHIGGLVGTRLNSSGFVTGVRAMSSDKAVRDPESVSYLSQREAREIDETLIGPSGFGADQLMELAGLSVATSIAEVYKPSEFNRVLAICGPGNTGSEGLIAARHMLHFGYKPVVCYPIRTAKALLESLPIPFLPAEDLPLDLSKSYDIVVDAIFGSSFHGSPRTPFNSLIQRLVALRNLNQKEKLPVIVSVDIPSGWHVEDGDPSGKGIEPDMLVSLTAPKMCAKKFSGRHHFLGGRFIPPSVAKNFKLRLPTYPGTSLCIRIGKPPQVDISALRENYIAPEFSEEQADVDPFTQVLLYVNPSCLAKLPVVSDGELLLYSVRMMMLKGFDKNGFVWYTNYESPKAREISENSRGAIVFYWGALFRQIIVEGLVEKVADEESDRYFQSRPRGSQIGAIVSKQSTVVSGREILHQQQEKLEAQFSEGSLIPRPKYWGGYRLKPELFEFWQGQPSNLHDRLRYTLEDIDGKRAWKIERLAP